MNSFTLNENQRRRAQTTRSTDAARLMSQRLTEPMRLWREHTLDMGLDSHAGARRSRHPAGIEPSSLRDRRVGTERFLGRHASA
jgi:hypothetical protein